MKQIKLGVALFLVIAATLLVAYYGILKEPDAVPPGFFMDRESLGLEALPATKSSFDALKEVKDIPLFEKLQKFGIWPLSTEPKGRPQPFVSPKEE